MTGEFSSFGGGSSRRAPGSPGTRPGFPFSTALHIAALALLSAGVVTAVAEPIPQVDSAAIRAHMSYLADDLLEGRATGSRGYDLAARYVVSQMQIIGLQPAGSDSGWLQPVELVESIPVIPAARATVIQGDAITELAPGADFVPVPSHHSKEASTTAPMVFVGFGIKAPEIGYDDFEGINLSGKVAVVLPGVPPTVPPERRVYYTKEKAQQIADRGAVGIVHLNMPAMATEAPWESVVARARVSSLRVLGASDQPEDTLLALEAGIEVSSAAASKVLSGAPKLLKRIWEDAEAGRPQSFELPGTISIATRSALRRIKSANVVGMLEGSDPSLRQEYVVLMAHLDHVGRGPAINGDAVYNGALDNASGTAILLESARALTSMKRRPRRSILFLAVTAEERGLVGSRHFALNPTVPRGSIVAVVNVDMPVALYPAAGYTIIGAEHSTLGRMARRALEAEGLKALPNQAPERGLFALADQYSFVREGIPALYLHDGPVSTDPAIDANRIFDDYLRRHYHQPSDQLDLPINWLSLAKLARVNARICYDIANDRRRPQWLPGDFYGQQFGQH